MEYEPWKLCEDIFARERRARDHRELLSVVEEYVSKEDLALLAMYVEYNFSPTALSKELGIPKTTMFYQIRSNLLRIQQCLPPTILNELRNIL